MMLFDYNGIPSSSISEAHSFEIGLLEFAS